MQMEKVFKDHISGKNRNQSALKICFELVCESGMFMCTTLMGWPAT